MTAVIGSINGYVHGSARELYFGSWLDRAFFMHGTDSRYAISHAN